MNTPFKPQSKRILKLDDDDDDDNDNDNDDNDDDNDNVRKVHTNGLCIFIYNFFSVVSIFIMLNDFGQERVILTTFGQG